MDSVPIVVIAVCFIALSLGPSVGSPLIGLMGLLGMVIVAVGHLWGP